MTRKLLMITTAIVAMAAAPVYAQSTSGTNSTASGVNARPPAANQMPAPAAPNAAVQNSNRAMSTTGQAAQPTGQMAQPTGQMAQPTGQMAQPTGQMAQPQMKSEQTMSPKGAAKSAKMERKGTNRASLSHRSPQYRAMNDKEVATTRDLNRQAVTGGVPQSAMTQSSMAPMPMAGSGSAPGQLGGQPNTSGASSPANDQGAPSGNK